MDQAYRTETQMNENLQTPIRLPHNVGRGRDLMQDLNRFVVAGNLATVLPPATDKPVDNDDDDDNTVDGGHVVHVCDWQAC